VHETKMMDFDYFI